MRKVIDIKPAVESELIPDEFSNQSYVLLPVIGDIGASYISSNFKNVPTTRAVSGTYTRIDFGKVESAKIEFSETDLVFQKNRPLIQYKKNLMSNIGEVEDKNLIEALVNAAQMADKYIDATSDPSFSPKHHKILKNMIDGDRLEAKTILTAGTAMNDLYEWQMNVFGNKNVEENWVGGSNRKNIKKLGDLDVISSIKEDAFVTVHFQKAGRPLGESTTSMKEAAVEKNADGSDKLDRDGNTIPVILKKTRKIFVLCDKEMLGTGRQLTPYKTSIEKKGDAIAFSGYEMLGMNIFARGVACLEVGTEL